MAHNTSAIGQGKHSTVRDHSLNNLVDMQEGAHVRHALTPYGYLWYSQPPTPNAMGNVAPAPNEGKNTNSTTSPNNTVDLDEGARQAPLPTDNTQIPTTEEMGDHESSVNEENNDVAVDEVVELPYSHLALNNTFNSPEGKDEEIKKGIHYFRLPINEYHLWNVKIIENISSGTPRDGPTNPEINPLNKATNTPQGAGHVLDDMKQRPNKGAGLLEFPSEIITEVCSYLDITGIGKLRILCRKLHVGSSYGFANCIKETKRIYPTRASINKWLGLVENAAIADAIDKVTVVGETLLQPQFGYEYSWNSSMKTPNANVKPRDFYDLTKIIMAHQNLARNVHRFIVSGTFRKRLTTIFSKLKNLKLIEITLLAPGEHIPEWVTMRRFKALSFYKEDLDTQSLFYGNILYDINKRKVMLYEDEFGEWMEDDGFGEQSTPCQDISKAAINSGTSATIRPIFRDILARRLRLHYAAEARGML